MPKNLFRFFSPNQIHLVGDNDRGNILLLGDDEKTVEHAHAGGGAGAGEDEYSLIGICQQDLSIEATRTRVHADDSPFTRQNFFDHARSFGEDADLDAIPNGDEIAFASALLQASP